jgi:hypothetical protein
MQKTVSGSPQLFSVDSIDDEDGKKAPRPVEDSKKSMLEDVEDETQFGSFPSSLSAMFRGFSSMPRRSTPVQSNSVAELSNAAANQLYAFNASDSYLRTPFRSFHALAMVYSLVLDYLLEIFF